MPFLFYTYEDNELVYDRAETGTEGDREAVTLWFKVPTTDIKRQDNFGNPPGTVPWWVGPHVLDMNSQTTKPLHGSLCPPLDGWDYDKMILVGAPTSGVPGEYYRVTSEAFDWSFEEYLKAVWFRNENKSSLDYGDREESNTTGAPHTTKSTASNHRLVLEVTAAGEHEEHSGEEGTFEGHNIWESFSGELEIGIRFTRAAKPALDMLI
jgi:hypothetical protein